jgi:uracil-DNA glycosylase
MSFKIALIGEAWGTEEEAQQKPFVGAAGQELDRMLADAGITRAECFTSNVFNLHPQRNDLSTLCSTKRSGSVVGEWPPLVPGKYLLREHQGEVTRLRRELEEVRPNVAVLLGNTACWAILQTTAISKLRGTARLSPVIPGLKCLPTYHPSAVLRQYDLRAVTVLDLAKAAREAEFSELRRIPRELWIEPSLTDIRHFISKHLLNAKEIAFDIETSHGEITCIGFSPRPDLCLVIPFVDVRKPGANYWPSLSEELVAWELVQYILRSPAKKLGQNTLYDIQWLWKCYGIEVTNYTDDTMLLHHALQPESPKGLGYLGSVYSNEVAWKSDRVRAKDTIKREDD